jgi:hypothetical protein
VASTLLLVALGGGALAAHAAPGAVVEARVLARDGEPLQDAWVWVVWDRGTPFRFEEGSRRVTNPKGHTGSDGRLRIEIPAGFFDPGDRLALAWEEKQQGRSHFTALHRARDGERLSFRLQDTGPAVDLGRLIAPEPRPD